MIIMNDVMFHKHASLGYCLYKDILFLAFYVLVMLNFRTETTLVVHKIKIFKCLYSYTQRRSNRYSKVSSDRKNTHSPSLYVRLADT